MTRGRDRSGRCRRQAPQAAHDLLSYRSTDM